MNESNQDDTRISLAAYGRKTGKKTRRKPLSPTRAVYEEDFPPLGVRVRRGVKMQLLIDAEAVKMNLGKYIESLVEKNHAFIEEIKAAAIEEGKQSRQKEVDDAFELGKDAGKADNADRAWRPKRL